MKHFSQQMIGMGLRTPHIQRHRRALGELLRRPGLTASEREHYQHALGFLGKPKIYSNLESPPPGAIDPGPMPPMELELDLEEATFDSLSTIPHSRLYFYARQEGLEVSPGDTKAQIVTTILSYSQGENP